MSKGFGYLLVFIASVSVTIGYQSCGKSSVKANSSDNDGLQVDVSPLTDDGADPTAAECDSENSLGLNLNCGDNFFYVSTSQATDRVATSRVLIKSYYVLMESHVYEAPSVTITNDLPQAYCENSALPHCAHLNNFVCQGFGCFEGPQPVRCHWQKRMNNALQNTTFNALRELRFVTRIVDNENPYVAGCNDPNLSLFKEKSSTDVSLAPKACGPDGRHYAVDPTGEGLRSIFANEISVVESNTNNTDEGEYCNNYSVYSYDTTKFNFRSQSGFVPQDQSFFYEAQYEALPVPNDPNGTMYGSIDLRWKNAGDATTYCIADFPINKEEIDTFFPSSGLRYEVHRPNGIISDVGTAEITYEDPVNGGANWRFFLTRGSSLTNGGGAIIDSTQAAAIRSMIEDTIIVAAQDFAQPCPGN